jgi:hypothetical protein
MSWELEERTSVRGGTVYQSALRSRRFAWHADRRGNGTKNPFGYRLSTGGSMRTCTRVQTPHDAEARGLIVEPLRALTPPDERLREPRPGVDGMVSRADRFLSSRTVSAMMGDASKRKNPRLGRS